MPQLSSEAHDPWQVGTGHDLAAILAIGLRKALGTHNAIDPETVEKWLRLAYERSFFQETQLYAAIRAWELRHPGFLILRGSIH